MRITHALRPALVMMTALVLAPVAPATLWAGGPGPADHHYIVVELDEHGFAVPVFHSRVALARPRTSLADDTLRKARRDDALVVRLTSDRTIVFQDLVPVISELRGEFHGDAVAGGFTIEHTRHRDNRPAAVIRVPAVPGAELEIVGRRRSTFSLDALEAGREALALAASGPDTTAKSRSSKILDSRKSGSPANRVDLLVMGDGYTEAEASTFADDADALVEAMFSITPYAEYANFVNTTTLFSPSQESGADHPPYDASCESEDRSCCGDSAAANDISAGTYVDTAFDGRYCAYNTHRLLVVDNAKVLVEAVAVPDWDAIFVVVNDSIYGGSGGRVAVASTHALSFDVIRHEYGHSFTGLADEYETPYPGFPACSDLTGPPCEANITDVTTRAQVKWEPWIDPATPLPTPENAGHGEEVGLFEGARYLSTGVYRPRDVQCLMRALSFPFCEICTQAYVLALYDGYWGEPVFGIDLIEPGTESPAPGTVETTESVTFSVDLLQPEGGPELDISWTVNGQVQTGQTGPDFTFGPRGPGTYRIRITATDTTTLVNPAMAGTSMSSSREWTVEIPRTLSYRRAGERRRPQ